MKESFEGQKKVKELSVPEKLKRKELAIDHAWEAQTQLQQVSKSLHEVSGMEACYQEAKELAEKVGELLKKLGKKD